ncbi:MAG: helix-turn-helix transcriptional regulator [Firmicutes bacterium]|nr:helix-turn-helix transcriptional regulator [Bacillota bacterium]
MAETLRTLDPKEMGRRVRIRREEKGLSRDSLAEKLNVTAQFIADIENGNKGISIKKLYLLCQILGVTADYILAGSMEAEEEDPKAGMAREEIMAFLQKCDAEQLDGIGKIARIYADGLRMK